MKKLSIPLILLFKEFCEEKSTKVEKAYYARTSLKKDMAISLIRLISKLTEKVIHDQTQQYLSDHKILYKCQSGFRTNHSTDTASHI